MICQQQVAPAEAAGEWIRGVGCGWRRWASPDQQPHGHCVCLGRGGPLEQNRGARGRHWFPTHCSGQAWASSHGSRPQVSSCVIYSRNCTSHTHRLNFGRGSHLPATSQGSRVLHVSGMGMQLGFHNQQQNHRFQEPLSHRSRLHILSGSATS